MKKTEIYYFSGSGNSLYIARKLQERMPGTRLTAIVSLLDKDIIEITAEIVGIVFPVHGMTMPIPVKRFLERADFKSAEYIFVVATRSGTKCLAFNRIDKLLKIRGKTLDAHFAVNMFNNDPKFEIYKIPTEQEIIAAGLLLENQLNIMVKAIVNREVSRKEDTDYIYPSGFALEQLVLMGMRFAENDGARDYFYADSKCTGCGTCEKVCLSRKVKMEGESPVWQNDVKCYLCYACVNYCPMQAAQIRTKIYMKSYTDKNGRYPHPYATVEEIAAQKCSVPISNT